MALSNRRFWGEAAAWTLAAGLAFGLVAAIIPNPIFGRSVPPEPFAVAVWLISAPLMGLIAATYGRSARAVAASMAEGSRGSGASAAVALPFPSSAGSGVAAAAVSTGGSTAATLGGVAAFLAIGCPLCNKVALLLLGASGALSIWAPLQPIIGAASLALLVGTLVWRLRLVASGGSCAVPS